MAHCDLKPQNILVDMKEGEAAAAGTGSAVVVKITDFGLSKMKVDADVSATISKTAVQNIGTPRFVQIHNCINSQILNHCLVYIHIYHDKFIINKQMNIS